jgi:hypothetical protein
MRPTSAAGDRARAPDLSTQVHKRQEVIAAVSPCQLRGDTGGAARQAVCPNGRSKLRSLKPASTSVANWFGSPALGIRSADAQMLLEVAADGALSIEGSTAATHHCWRKCLRFDSSSYRVGNPTRIGSSCVKLQSSSHNHQRSGVCGEASLAALCQTSCARLCPRVRWSQRHVPHHVEVGALCSGVKRHGRSRAPLPVQTVPGPDD